MLKTPSENLGRSLIQGVLWSALERWGNRLLSLAVFVILARLLVPEDFGQITVVRLVIDYLDTFVAQGLGLAIIQRQDLNKKHLDSAFWANIFVSGTIVLLLCFLSPYVAEVFHSPTITPLLQCLAATLLISGLSRTQAALLTKEMKFKALSLRSLLMATLGGLTGIILALLGMGVWSLVWQQMVSSVVGLIVLWKTSSWRPGFYFSKKEFLELYRFSKNVFLDQQIRFFSTRIDEAIIGMLLGTTQLGYYSIAKRLLTTLNLLLTNVLDRVLFSTISKIQHDQQLVNRLTLASTYLLSAISFPIFFISIAVSGPLITVLFGEKWISADRSFQILMFSGPFLLIPALIHISFLSIGKSGIPFFLNIFRSAIGLILIYFSATYGLVGIAFAVLIKDILGATLDLLIARKVLSLNMLSYLKHFFSFVLASTIMLVSVYLLKTRLILANFPLNIVFFISILSGVTLYILILFLFHRNIILYNFKSLATRPDLNRNQKLPD